MHSEQRCGGGELHRGGQDALCPRNGCRRRCCGGRVLRRPPDHPNNLAGVPQKGDEKVRRRGDTK